MFRPRSHQYLGFADDFGPRFMVFVDTEEEFDWTGPRRRDSTSVTAVRALPYIHELMRSYGAEPAYLVDHPVATDDSAVAILRSFLDAGGTSVGAQLHPWVNPPFIERVDAKNSFVGNLPKGVERAKLSVLTNEIENAFGARPIVYRAGRYGVGPNSEALLDELGYRLDVSVRPFFDYAAEGGPNFRGIVPRPYWTGPEQRLVELPLSTVFTGGLRGVGERAFRMASAVPHLNGFLSRSRLLSRVALTPEGIPVAEAERAVDRLVADRADIIAISFHSPSVEPGNTPYVRDDAELQLFYSWFHRVFERLLNHGARPIGVDDFLAACAQQRGPEAAIRVEASADRA